MVKKSRHSHVTQRASPSASTAEDVLEHGVEKVIFSHLAPNQFRMLSGLCGVQLGFWLWAGAQHHFGQTIAFLGFGWCGFGVFISSVMILMVWWHARRHVARLAIIPGVVDEVIVSTHNMLGGVQDLRVSRFEIVTSQSDSSDKYARLKVHGHNLQFIVDREGDMHEPALLERLLRGTAFPKRPRPAN